MRGRKPKPTHLKVVTGNPGKRPLAADDAEPIREAPAPPSHLNAYAREEWHRVCAELIALRILTMLDTATLAAYCESFGMWRLAAEELNALEIVAGDRPGKQLLSRTRHGTYIQNPLVGIINKAKADMVRYAAEFGLTPSARARVSAGVAPPPNKFAGLIGGRQA